MSNRAWATERIRLRAPDMSDLALFVAHAAEHADDARLYGDHIGMPPSSDRLRGWLEREIAKDNPNERMLVLVKPDGVPVGTLNTSRADLRAGVFWYSVVVFPGHQRQGYAREGLRLLLRAFFDELRFHKVQALVHANNTASIAFHTALGFVEEGRLREACFTEGQRSDDIIFGLTADEFRSGEL